MKKNHSIDMTNGPFLKKLLTFAFPLMLTGVLQIVYNAADVLVVGRFAGSTSLAAVGSTGSLVNLIVNLFIGLSTGTGVVTAKYIGARNSREITKSIHTAMSLSVLSGFAVALIGYFLSPYLLTLMGSPDDVLPLATQYLKIYFLGAPASLVYNFGASIVRSTGDTKRPLYILSVAGLINVCLNLLFVIKFHLDVAGVAIATITAQYISAVVVVILLTKYPAEYRLDIKKLKIHKSSLKEIAAIGLPAGFQGSLFSISNVVIQSSINSFGSTVMAASSAASNADAFIYPTTNAIAHTSMTFTSQNIGAGKHENIPKIFRKCLILAFIISASLGIIILVFSKEFISIFTTDEAVIPFGVERLKIMMTTYYFCGLMDVAGCQIRGMGRSLEPMIITLLGACGLRVLWVFTIFKFSPTLDNLFFSYPVSWATTFIVLMLFYFRTKKKLSARLLKEPEKNEA